ncbi:MAG: hypothetical protein O2856_16020, partial [Planctomycetota bacterium]|nr:hypothetical protein [Planctomycetota bacterium]
HQLKQETEAAKWLDKSLAWKQANEAALLQDTELQSFYAEAKQLMAPADTKAAADPKPQETPPTTESDRVEAADKATVKPSKEAQP